MHIKTLLVLLAVCSGAVSVYSNDALAQGRANGPTFDERRGSPRVSPQQTFELRRMGYDYDHTTLRWTVKWAFVDRKLEEAIAKNDYAYQLAHYQKKCSTADLPSDTAIDDYSAAGKGVGNCHYLAELYWNGHGVERDTAKALSYYQMAADGGFWPSVEFLAGTYLAGQDVPRDASKAVALLTRFTTKPKTSTQLTCISAMHLASVYRTGHYIEKSGTEAVKWYRHCIDRISLRDQPTPEVLRALTHLANMYNDGDLVPADPAQAAKLYTRVLEVKTAPLADRANAQFRLGTLYVSGRGVKKDAVRGIGLLTAASKAQHPDASLALYKFYAAGQDVEANPALAAHYLRLAADLNQVEAQYLMARQSMAATPPDLGEARAWYESAGAQGHRDAQYELGQFHIQYPSDSDRSHVRAWVWFDLAAQNGHPQAAQARDDVAKRLPAEDLSRAKAMEASLKARFPDIAPA